MTPAERNQYFEETAPLRKGAGIFMVGATLSLGGAGAYSYALRNPATTVNGIRKWRSFLFEATTEQNIVTAGVVGTLIKNYQSPSLSQLRAIVSGQINVMKPLDKIGGDFGLWIFGSKGINKGDFIYDLYQIQGFKQANDV